MSNQVRNLPGPLSTASSTSIRSRLQAVIFVESYPHVVAGQQRTMLSLLEAAPRRGIEPSLLTPAKGIYTEAVQSRGIIVDILEYPHNLSRYGGAIYRDGIRRRAKTLRDWLGYLRSCRSLLKERRPSAVFCNDMRGLLTVGVAARSLRIPVMIWDKLDKPHGMLDWFQLPIANVNAVISNSVTVKYPQWQQRWYQSKIELIPNGADIERFTGGTSIRDQLGIDEDCVVIGIVGTVTHRKGHDRLLELIPQLADSVPKLSVLVIGSWEDSSEDEAFYQSLPHRDHPAVQFLGSRSDMPDLMQTLDILTIPSRHEGMGQVTAEAMAAGKPVVGSNVGGIPEVVVDGETGLIFEPDDSRGYLECLVRLAGSRELREQMGERGRERCRAHYHRAVQIERVCKRIRELMSPDR